MSDKQPEQESERTRTRSPSYPAFGLATAIDRALALYKRDGKASVSPASAVKAWGYNSLNGRSLRVLATMRQFGLIEEAGPKSIRLTPLAIGILLSSQNSNERIRALETAATMPPIFVKLAAQYDDAFPSDESMVHNLVVHDGFNEEAARKVVTALRETLSLVDKVMLPLREPKPLTRARSLGGQRFEPEEGPAIQGVRMSDATGTSMDLPIPLASGSLAILRMPRSMTEEDYAMLTTMLETILRGMKRGLVRATALGQETIAEEE